MFGQPKSLPVDKLYLHFNPFKALSHAIRLYKKKEPVQSQDIQVFLVQYTYYWGVVPFYYEEKYNKFILPTDKRSLVCSGGIISVQSLFIFMMFVNLLKGLVSEGFVVTSMNHVFTLFYSCSCIGAGLAHLHTFYKRDAIVQLLNHYGLHIKYLHGKKFI